MQQYDFFSVVCSIQDKTKEDKKARAIAEHHDNMLAEEAKQAQEEEIKRLRKNTP